MSTNAIIGLVMAALVLGAAWWLYDHGKDVATMEGQVVTKEIVLDKAVKNAAIQTNRPDYDALVNRVFNSGTY